MDPKLAARFARLKEQEEKGETDVGEIGSAAQKKQVMDPILAARLSKQQSKEGGMLGIQGEIGSAAQKKQVLDPVLAARWAKQQSGEGDTIEDLLQKKKVDSAKQSAKPGESRQGNSELEKRLAKQQDRTEEHAKQLEESLEGGKKDWKGSSVTSELAGKLSVQDESKISVNGLPAVVPPAPSIEQQRAQAEKRSCEAADVPQVPNQWYEEWVKNNVPDMSGKVAIVTGSNSGTGFWCANALAGKGAQVVLACRSTTKATLAQQEILQNIGRTGKVDVIQLDNMKLSSVREFASQFKAKYQRLDLLINNAGIMAQPEVASDDGYDVQFQTNHLAHFLLTQQLWDVLLKTPSARVVSHSSCAHWMGGAKFNRDAMKVPPTGCGWCCVWNCIAPMLGLPAKTWKRYSMSKLCNVLFGLELQRKIDAAGLGDKISSTMAHPGYASTQLQKYAGDAGSFKGWEDSNSKHAQSAADGSLPLLMACISPEIKGGMYAGPSLTSESKGPPQICQLGGSAKNKAMAADLWNYSEECCKSKFGV